MRQLTFEGFLGAYVRHLSGQNTLSLARLADLLAEEPRLIEPLLLWATVVDKSDRLGELLSDHPDLLTELDLLVALRRSGRLEAALADEDSQLRPEYPKAWRSYVVRRDACKRDAVQKMKVRERVLALEPERQVSRYRVAKDLGLNPGNLHAFLVKGDPRKMGLQKAYQLLTYLESRPSSV